MYKKLSFLFVAFIISLQIFGQTAAAPERKNGWHLLDEKKDGYEGISLQQAYDLLKGRKSTTIIVAVIDSGIDTLQEDLKSILWKNSKEISGNGIDDDGNGYVDDIYGWNFCGSKTGENLAQNTHEISRVYHNWKNEFEGKKEKDIPADRKFLYGQWKKAADLINKDYEEANKEIDNIGEIKNMLEESSTTIYNSLSVKEFTETDVKKLLNNSDREVVAAATFWASFFKRAGIADAKNTLFITDITDYHNQLTNKINRKMIAPVDFRGELTHDNYTDINDSIYGNNNLSTGSGNHGTLVSGTIAAVRNNGIGMDGIADNVRIMAIRAVPGGDEHDKDVALAIRYAVDNGAKIINMSFGKPVSPYKQFVDDAVKYAASKGVLLVHGSGNDGKDITQDIFYPNPYFLDGKKASNYITVGASGDHSTGGYAATFSNYSKSSVDVFAPGMNIYSTAANNTYESADGTSLACPVVTGVAALLKSYFPSLSPEEMITILTTTGTVVKELVNKPGGDKKVKFESLCVSGKIINAADAVQKALELEKK